MQTAILTKLTSNLSEILVYGAIGLITLIGLLKCIYPVLRNARLLNRAVSRLESTTSEGETPAWRESRFLGRSLRREWKEFLLNAGQLDLRGIPCDTKDYINEETVIDVPGHSQLAELIPGLLTSLGILGTFMGLMQGLSSIDFSNAAGTMSSIPELLGGMRFAFATSVAGIACSLCFNLLNRIAVSKAHRALEHFETEFYELAMPRPLQPDVQMLCQKQDEEARLNHMVDTVSTRLAASVESAVSRAAAPMAQSMDAFLQGASHDQTEGVRRIVMQFIQQMNLSLNGQMSSLGETMSMVSKAQLQNQQVLNGAMNTVSALTQDAETVHASVYGAAESMNRLSGTLQQESALRADAEARQQAALQQLANEMTALSQSLERLRILSDTLYEQMSASETASPQEERS